MGAEEMGMKRNTMGGLTSPCVPLALREHLKHDPNDEWL